MNSNPRSSRLRWTTIAAATAAVTALTGAGAQAAGVLPFTAATSTTSETVVLSAGTSATSTSTGTVKLGPATVIHATSATTQTATVLDTFDRTVTGSWASTPSGQSWTTSGGTSAASVAGGVGRMTAGGAGWHVGQTLAGYSASSTEVQATVALEAALSGGGVDVDVIGRQVDSTHRYLLRLKMLTTGVVRATLLAQDGSTTRTVQQVNVPNLAYTTGLPLHVRMQVTGTGTTTLKAKVWNARTAEPSSWTVSGTDTAAGLQRSGGIALGMYTSSTSTVLPQKAAVDRVWAGAPASAPVLATLGTAQPAPTPEPTPEPTPVPVPQPVTSGPPGPDTTGVPAGKTLKVHTGDLVITTAGTVIDGLDIRGFVTVKAPNVVIRNSIIRGTATSKQRALVSSSLDTASVTIEDSELFAASPSGWIDGIRGWNITARRVDIHHVIDAVHIYGSNVTIEDSWLHDNLHYENDPAQNGTPSHDDSIQIQKGSNIRILNNHISGAFNTGIQFTQDQGTVSDVKVIGNFADGGGCTVNFAEKGRGPFQNVTVSDNTFGRTTKHLNCAIIAPDTTRTVLTATNNFFTDGTVATVRRG